MIDLWEAILSDGQEALLGLIEERASENLTLDFKRKENAAYAKLDRNDQKYLGEALSGFSNAQGGLLIWGIDASKNHDNIDCAREAKPISDIATFRRNVESLIPSYLIPENPDVETKMIETSGSDASGYLVLRVGRSNRRPHMSRAPGHHKYFRRVFDSFLPMEHYEIEDLFRVNISADLKLESNFIRQPRPPRKPFEGLLEVRIAFSVLNESLITAKHPYIIWYCREGMKPSSVSWNQVYKRKLEEKFMYAPDANEIIHLGHSIDVMEFSMKMTYRGPLEPLKYEIPGHGEPVAKQEIHSISFHFDVGCENTRAKYYQFTFDAETICAAFANVE